MSVKRVNFALGKEITSVDNTARDLIYTSNNGVGNISAATARNTSGQAVELSVYIRGDADTTGTAAPIDSVSIPAGETCTITKLIGHNVPFTGSIQADADTTGVIELTISGTTKA